jgi:serine/arginine repetitive matrix protein 2
VAPSQGSVPAAPTLQSSEPPHDVVYSHSGTPTAGGHLAVPPSGKAKQGSIALRAIRSVRSLARMGSWAQLKNMPPPDEDTAPATVKEKSVKKKKTKEGDAKEEKGGEKKTKKNKKNKSTKKDKSQTVRLSSSSFDVGGLTASPEAPKTIGPKKHSILGLGLPSTMRLPTVREPSTSSSVAPVANRLSADSANILSRNRSGSVLSSESSLRPVSLTSTDSRASSGSSTASVRWDEQGLETVREQRKKEREVKRQIEEKSDRRSSKESRRSSEGRRRTPLPSIFPSSQQPGTPPKRHSYPIVTIEEATSDGHGGPDEDEVLQEEPQRQQPVATPKKARVRPLSEQLLGRNWLRPAQDDDEGQFILFYLILYFILKFHYL